MGLTQIGIRRIADGLGRIRNPQEMNHHQVRCLLLAKFAGIKGTNLRISVDWRV